MIIQLDLTPDEHNEICMVLTYGIIEIMGTQKANELSKSTREKLVDFVNASNKPYASGIKGDEKNGTY